MFLICGSSWDPALSLDCELPELLPLGELVCDRFEARGSISDRLLSSFADIGFFLELPAGEWVGDVFIGGVLGDCSI